MCGVLDAEDGHCALYFSLNRFNTVNSYNFFGEYYAKFVMFAVFTIGNVIYIALEIEYQFDPVTAKCSGVYSWTFFFRLVFVLLQTFFLFKNRTVCDLHSSHA